MPDTTLTFEVLNATADDWESLEQIHPAVEQYRGGVTPAEVAAEIVRLVRAGHLECRPAGPSDIAAVLADPAAYWFHMTAAGRDLWRAGAEAAQ